MAEETFSIFNNLPLEIQQLIWDSAVRPVPGTGQVQCFIIIDHYTNPVNPPYPINGDCLRLGNEGRINPGFKLAVPHHDALDGGNTSTYLTDSGLWMACRESRAAMERYYKKNEWWSDVPSPLHPCRLAKPGEYHQHNGVSHTASYVKRDGDIQHITISPADDLIHLAPLKLDQVNWWHHYAGETVPVLDGDQSKLGRSFLGLNIAVDYHPMMMNVLRGLPRHQCAHTWSGESHMSLVDMVDVFHENLGRTLWFIDSRLRRRRPNYTALRQSSSNSSVGTAKDKKRVQFYSSNCVFSEVKREDLSDWTTEDDENAEPDTVFDLFDLLHEQENGRLEIENSDRMRVLACEAQPGEAVKSRRKLPTNAPCEDCVALQIAEKERQESQALMRRTRKGLEAVNEDDEIDLEGWSLFD